MIAPSTAEFPAIRYTLPEPPERSMEPFVVKMMSPSASNVKLLLPPSAIRASTVILPRSTPPPLAVETIVLRLESFVCNVVFRIMEAVRVGVKTSGSAPDQPPLALTPPIVTLYGSISQTPDLPFEAEASTSPAISILWPDVSTNPPSPDNSPPLALIKPYTLVVSLDHKITLPPFPSVSASALMTASGPKYVKLEFCKVPKP